MNAAQKLMILMGVDKSLVFVDRTVPRLSKSHTKKGPGRKHQQGRAVEAES